jgi:hypothetical protein
MPPSISSRVGTDGAATHQVSLSGLIKHLSQQVAATIPGVTEASVALIEAMPQWIVTVSDRPKGPVQERPFLNSVHEPPQRTRLVGVTRRAGHRVVLEIVFNIPESIAVEK